MGTLEKTLEFMCEDLRAAIKADDNKRQAAIQRVIGGLSVLIKLGEDDDPDPGEELPVDVRPSVAVLHSA